MSWILFNLFFMCFSLWLAFAKANRPITWGAFYLNLAAAGLNFLAIVIHIFRLVTA